MHAPISRAAYLELLFENFADECVQASRDGTLERPLELRRDLGRAGNSTICLVTQILIVPDDYVSAHLGRKPYQHD
jgi:hypothetical protein